MYERPKPERGLPAIRQLRLQRKHRPHTAGTKFWLWGALAFISVTIFYCKKSQLENDAYRVRILSKQRAIAADMGNQFAQLREQVETFTLAMANPTWPGDLPEGEEASEGAKNEIRLLLARPGVYLRLTQPEGKSVASVREAATGSLKDAFLTCFLRSQRPDPHQGRECRATRECSAGEICNEVNHCGLLTQPYNLRIAYRGARVLSESWMHEVEVATEELRLRLFETDLKSSTENDIPFAIDLLKRSHYFLLLVDEVPEGIRATAGASLVEAVQAEIHPVRLGIWDLHQHRVLVRLRRTVDVTIPAVPNGVDVQRRQVLNCELARETRQFLGL